jgi:hypothetical protein
MAVNVNPPKIYKMKWIDDLPNDFEWGGPSTPVCCWVKPNIWGEDEPVLGELERHVYPDADGEHGILINTMNGSIDVKVESIKRKYAKISPPPEHGWSDVPPDSTGWYWVRTDVGDVDPVMVYLDHDEETLVFSGIDWPSFRVTPVTSPNLSWVEIPLPE